MSRPVSRYLHPLEPRRRPAFEPEVERARIASLALRRSPDSRPGGEARR